MAGQIAGGPVTPAHPVEQARQAYEKALQFNPDHPPTYNNLATLYIHLGNPEKAIPLLQKALRLNPDYQNHPDRGCAASFAVSANEVHWAASWGEVDIAIRISVFLFRAVADKSSRIIKR